MSRIYKTSTIIGHRAIDFNPVQPVKEEPEPEEIFEEIEEEEGISPEEERKIILDEAKLEARRTIEEAKKQAKKELEEAKRRSVLLEEEAKKKGFARGQEEGKTLFGKKSKEIWYRLEKILQEIDQRMKNYEKEYPLKITELSLGIAQEVIRREVEEDPQIVVQVAKDAITSLNGVAEATIRVNWRDLPVMEEAKEELLSSLKGLRRVHFQEDAELEPGGTIIETPQGGIDASIRTRFDKIKEDLLGVVQDE